MTPHTLSFSFICVLTIFTLFHCSLSITIGNTTNIRCIEYEKAALLEFKNDLVDGANLLFSWNNSNEDCCKWYGITCNNQTGRVTEIRLRGSDDMAGFENQDASIQKLGGKLNPSLRNLTSLEVLDLSSNDFGGNPIPTYVGSLKTLTYLNLSESSFSGEVPSQLGNLSALLVLSVRNIYSGDQYELRAESLRWLSGLPRLRHLDMGGVQLGQVFDWSQVTRTLPSSLVELHLSYCGLPPITPGLTINLSSLSTLDLSYNNFSTNSIPIWISSLRSLVSLNLAYCQFNGPVPSGLMDIISLTTLDLSYNQLTGIQTTSENICNLREISLSGNKFDGKNLSDVLASLFQCESSQLESLRFAVSGLSGNLPPQIGNLKNLVNIDLNGNSISGSIPDSLGNLSSLRTLELVSNQISGTLPDSIGRLSSLETLYLSSNLISGPLPDSLGRLSSLVDLDLSNNEINGTLPLSIGQLTNLINFNIDQNLLRGVVTEDHFANLTSLVTLGANGNMLRFELSDNNWEPPFQLERLSLNSWSLGPNFPPWLQNQRNLFILYIASTGISDDIPSWFWNSLSGLKYVNISDNNFSSMSLDDFFCPNEEQKQVIYINLGNTNISGVLPDCWTTWEFLNIFNIQNNNLTGELPRSLANLSSLESLNMRNNKLSGELPATLMNSMSLQIIDLAENEFTGGIPISIGGEASVLKLLNLRSNRFNGEIPDELCRLDSIQILDLADNNLSGRIPKCFHNFSVIAGKVDPSQIFELAKDEFMGSAWLVTKGRMNGYSSILGLVTYLDLSGNDLSGGIPSEITQLVELRSLNLSGNGLTGRIPENIGDMKVLEALDLSRNRLDGVVPLSMSRLNFLNWLNLSYNDLTGRIPTSTQIQSLGESSFLGNRLCGAPLRLMCERQGGGGGGGGGVGDVGEEEGDGGSDGPDWGLITSIVVGFVVGFWVVVGPLIGSKSWREKYFEFLYDIWCKFCYRTPKNSSKKRFRR
ncbi:hypothetical protein L2E82_31889 [Cichorium intybus]|uniref:Uncharacterized protein n=1 Tax=Cichorium intybus TaxID=13427 RepID=A0ACB9BF70_CICIN|nr:hypothetical protein L2E82_31889 [Cichorium intybus]